MVKKGNKNLFFMSLGLIILSGSRITLTAYAVEPDEGLWAVGPDEEICAASEQQLTKEEHAQRLADFRKKWAARSPEERKAQEERAAQEQEAEFQRKLEIFLQEKREKDPEVLLKRQEEKRQFEEFCAQFKARRAAEKAQERAAQNQVDQKNEIILQTF
jgi:hypothetical protein